MLYIDSCDDIEVSEPVSVLAVEVLSVFVVVAVADGRRGDEPNRACVLAQLSAGMRSHDGKNHELFG